MKLINGLGTLVAFALVGCSMQNQNQSNQEVVKNQRYYAETIKPKELKEYVYTLASDEFEGRDTGSEGQKKAANYLRDFYKKNKIASAKGLDYFQIIPEAYLNGMAKGPTENVLAFVEGSDKKAEVIVISAHYDHIGVDDTGIYNGADDDASGTASLMEIAQAFQMAKNEGKGPRRSILFLHVSGEEKGLYGSKYYSENPIYPLENTVTNLNSDMIGRIDEFHKTDSNYIYLIGTTMLSTELHNVSEEVNKKYLKMNLDYRFNDKDDPNRFYYRSDHYNFAKHNIPVIFYFNGVHEDYHQITDTPDKISYDILAKRAKLIFYTAWELANRENRVALDEKKTEPKEETAQTK